MNPATRAALHRLNLTAAAEAVRQAAEFLSDDVPAEAEIKSELLAQAAKVEAMAPKVPTG